MNLKKVLNTTVMQLDLPGNNKREVIESLLDILMKTGKVKDRDAALESILERENKMSTGLQSGVAIPHANTDTVDKLIACVAIKKRGIDFEALDGLDTKIFIMTLSPKKQKASHIQFLAEISKIFRNKVIREKLIHAESKEAMLQLLLSPMELI